MNEGPRQAETLLSWAPLWPDFSGALRRTIIRIIKTQEWLLEKSKDTEKTPIAGSGEREEVGVQLGLFTEK